jgi:hypothetical protein
MLEALYSLLTDLRARVAVEGDGDPFVEPLANPLAGRDRS